ncbi:uncharacterized protein LOC135824372 [Sycon ciliatum]|uniref:uncharacterized protein LOC135824372 n=1 Tax=Sycon ciliatum TaxID=27933 RepID=UPI0031F70645
MSTPVRPPASVGRGRPRGSGAVSNTPLQPTVSSSHATDGQPVPAPPPAAVTSVSLKLPPFWPNDPQLWFTQVEAQFAIKGITVENTKYQYVVSSLTHEFAHEVRDVLLQPPTQQPYTNLKRHLVERLCASEQKRIRQLLTEAQLGDRRPSQFLRHLRQLQGASVVESAVLQELFLQRLPPHVRMVLASASSLSLEQQASLADNLMEIASTPQPALHHVAATPVSPSPDASMEPQELRTEISSLHQQLDRASSSQHRGRSQSPGHGRSKSPRRPQKDQSDDTLCFYHRRFGDKAQRCTMPCSESENFRASH